MIETKIKEHKNLGELKNQMKDMSQDFEDMKNARIESKRQLELRFERAYADIDENREFTIDSMNQVHNTLKEFQDKFQDELAKLSQDLKNQINEEGEIFREEWKKNHEQMDKYEEAINKEREDRIKYHDDYLNPIRAQLKGIQDGIVKEKKTRIANEKDIHNQITQESQNMQNDIKNEHASRQQRMQDLDDQLTQDTNLTNKFLDNFENQAKDTATTFMSNLDQELKNRFEHQDNMLANMSEFVAKFQKTLKIFGKDV